LKVLVLGGYGEFGGRLSELLLRDGHEVLIAGRSVSKARAFCERHGGVPVQLDSRRDLALLQTHRPEVVVDAAGPFQRYGADPYRVVRAALEAGAHYLDLCDEPGFASGIARLDHAAKAANRVALSGVSSTPALSSAVVRNLGRSLNELEMVETAILPGCKAPLGRSTMASVLSQVGEPVAMWRGGRWVTVTGWSQSRQIPIGDGRTRRASLVSSPDTALFPDFFGAKTVLFRAGLEQRTLDRCMYLLSLLRKPRLVPNLSRAVGPLRAVGKLLASIGRDEGAMVVEVTGRRYGEDLVRYWRWTLQAAPGQGPYVPTIPVRAILRDLGALPPGARPALAELGLEKLEAAMVDLNVRFSVDTGQRAALIQTALGESWFALPTPMRVAHSVQDQAAFVGRADVTRGNSFLARFAAWFFGFPKAGTEVPLRLVKTRTDTGETWDRTFAGKRLRSYLTPSRAGHYRERFWAFVYEQELPVANGCLYFPVRRGWVLGIPLPRWFLPRSETREYCEDDVFRFDVSLQAPVTGELIVRYRGWMKPDESRQSRGQARYDLRDMSSAKGDEACGRFRPPDA